MIIWGVISIIGFAVSLVIVYVGVKSAGAMSSLLVSEQKAGKEALEEEKKVSMPGDSSSCCSCDASRARAEEKDVHSQQKEED